jgi:hypothetical protein
VLVASRVVCVPIFHAEMVDGVGQRVGFTASRMVLAVEMIMVFFGSILLPVEGESWLRRLCALHKMVVVSQHLVVLIIWIYVTEREVLHSQTQVSAPITFEPSRSLIRKPILEIPSKFQSETCPQIRFSTFEVRRLDIPSRYIEREQTTRSG